MQMSKFWRPSAWADYVHAYTPRHRSLFGRYYVNHLCFSPLIVVTCELPLLGLVISYGLGNWRGWLSLVAFILLKCILHQLRLEKFLRCNLAPDDKSISTNMPTLFTHLRQLETAGHIIRSHVSHSISQNRQANAASVSSNLALMQAMRHHSHITTNLEARLVSAYARCFRNASATFAFCRQDVLDVEAELADPEVNSKSNALQRLQDSMRMGALGMPSGLEFY